MIQPPLLYQRLIEKAFGDSDQVPASRAFEGFEKFRITRKDRGPLLRELKEMGAIDRANARKGPIRRT